jgi:predicted nucleotidyltransferase component of viral defense system
VTAHDDSLPGQHHARQGRSTRPASTQGFEAALVDIAQDLLLRHLHDIGLLGELAFKGGTALRKLYAGAAGRFSLDLDFSVASIGTHTATLMALLDAEEHTVAEPHGDSTHRRLVLGMLADLPDGRLPEGTCW